MLFLFFYYAMELADKLSIDALSIIFSSSFLKTFPQLRQFLLFLSFHLGFVFSISLLVVQKVLVFAIISVYFENGNVCLFTSMIL